MKKTISLLLAAVFLLATVSLSALAAEPGQIDYMALVNKLHPLPEGWEESLKTVHVTNSVGDDVEVEEKAFAAYEELRKDLEENDGIYLELDSARRSVAAQQEIMDRYIEKYGADYAAKTVAVPGFSEHHTGLALDLYFKLKNDDGTFTDVYYNEDLVRYPEIWEKIHMKLADYGFILRYLDGREHLTGYGYEPWHIRYLDDTAVAKEIMDKDIYIAERGKQQEILTSVRSACSSGRGSPSSGKKSRMRSGFEDASFAGAPLYCMPSIMECSGCFKPKFDLWQDTRKGVYYISSRFSLSSSGFLCYDKTRNRPPSERPERQAG
jgi:D-alanyl-D-alanine carboxypeptidase